MRTIIRCFCGTCHEIGHILGGRHDDGYIGQAQFDVDGEPRNDRFRTIMTITAEMSNEGTPLPYIRRFSSPSAQVNGSVGCDVYVRQMSGGVRQTPLICDFTQTPIGDETHDAVGVINTHIDRVSQFR